MHSNCKLLPNLIVCKMTQRHTIRRANTCDPALNEEITTDIQKHKQTLWKEHLDAQRAYSLEDHIRSIQQRPPPPTKHFHNIQHKITTTPKHIANCFTKRFPHTAKHATHKTNRSNNRATHTIQGSLSSELLVCGGGVCSVLLLPLVARCIETIDVCIWRIFLFMSFVVTVWGSVGMFVV